MVALLKKYEALLFDADAGTVRPFQWDGELYDLYEAMKCDLVDTIRLSADHIFFVDDEGLLKQNQPGGFSVTYKGREVEFIGSGLLVGDAFGEPRSVSLDVSQLVIHYFSYGKEEA